MQFCVEEALMTRLEFDDARIQREAAERAAVEAAEQTVAERLRHRREMGA